MSQMMYKEININKVLYKTLTTINFYSKNMRSLFKSIKSKKKAGWRARAIDKFKKLTHFVILLLLHSRT